MTASLNIYYDNVMQVAYYIIFAIAGLLVGSFLNVVIDRVPKGKSIVSPPSHCDSCGQRLAGGDLVPIFSYLRTRGKCRYCGAPIPIRVLWVETASRNIICPPFLEIRADA